MRELDGVRGAAALLVMLCHFSIPYRELADLGRLERALGHVVSMGGYGVDLFFVLSGFLITGILLDTMNAPNFLSSFYARRALRIFPLYYAYLVVWFGIGPVVVDWLGGDPASIGSGVQGWYWSYLQNWASALRGIRIPALSHFWSLAVEEQFYVAWPAIIWLCRTPRRAAAVSLLGALAVIAIRTKLVVDGTPAMPIYWSTATRADALCWGAALAAGVRTPHAAAILRVAPKLLAAVAGTMILHPALRNLDAGSPVFQVGGYTLLAVACAALVALTYRLRATSHPLARVLRSGPLAAAGKYSYAIYVFHYPVYLGTAEMLGRSHPEVLRSRAGLLGLVAAWTVLTMGAAVVSWHLLESRCLRVKRRFAARTDPAAREAGLDAISAGGGVGAEPAPTEGGLGR